MRQSKRRIDGLHAAHEVMVLGRADEWSEPLAGRARETPARLVSKRTHAAVTVRHSIQWSPAVAIHGSRRSASMGVRACCAAYAALAEIVAAYGWVASISASTRSEAR